MTIDSSTWKTYDFGDIALNLTETSKDPLSEGFERYVGLEHLEPGNMHINSWGNIAEGTTFTRIFRKKQVLFGKRRAYQRKAALAEFDGICSGDILVFEANEKNIIPELVPFIVQSDKFFDYAIKTSAGSLSPRTKFKDMAKLKFKLPPLDEQRHLADLLWSVDESVERKKGLMRNLAILYDSILKETCKEGQYKEECIIGDVCIINKANLSSNTDPSYEFRYLDIASIVKPNTLGVLERYEFSKAPSRARRIVEKGNMVLSLVRPYHRSFVIMEEDCKDLIASTGTAVLEVNDKVDRNYLFNVFFSRKFLQYCEQRMAGTNYPAITPTDLKQYKLFLPSLKMQNIIGKKLSLIKKMESENSNEIARLTNIKQKLTNQIFG